MSEARKLAKAVLDGENPKKALHWMPVQPRVNDQFDDETEKIQRLNDTARALGAPPRDLMAAFTAHLISGNEDFTMDKFCAGMLSGKYVLNGQVAERPSLWKRWRKR